MQRAILLAVILVTALGMSSAQRVTVQQLERVLASSLPAAAGQTEEIGKTDLLDEINREDSLAPRLAMLELTERLTATERARLTAKFSLGPMTRSALELLADRSAFLDPPANELPGLPQPDFNAQKTMLRQAGGFVFQTLSHLPDFFARLTTTQFDDGPVLVGNETVPTEPGMHLVGSSERDITFTEGREVADSSRVSVTSNRNGELKRDEGLASQGEFGTEAAIVFLDLARGTLSFHHWEASASGPVAVFRYSVPQSGSHYEVNAACHGRPNFQAKPAYRGTLSIDPATGVLVRFTVQAESSPGDPITQVSSAIEYGAVILGDRRYFCPVRSLALSVEEADTCRESHTRKLARPITMLNRIIFSDYHRLGSEIVVLPGMQQPVKTDSDSESPKPGDTTPQTLQPEPQPPQSQIPQHR